MVVGLLIFVFLQCFSQVHCDDGTLNHQSLPIFPSGLFARFESAPASSTKAIPKNIWVAVVNVNETTTWPHIEQERKLNPGWEVHLCDNEAKDSFMREYFTGSRLLWAYENINPIVGGAAKADIWRYAVLLIKGGVYIDADSALTKPLDGVIADDDELLITFETNVYDGDWCYSPNSKLSTLLLNRHHPTAKTMQLFHNRIILNWCIMSAPRHLFLKKALENFVHLVELEYMGMSALKMQKYDKYSKHVYCTTGPSLFTASCREAVIKINEAAAGAATATATVTATAITATTTAPDGAPLDPVLVDSNYRQKHRLASRDFIREGGVFKVVNTVNEDKNHYTKATNHHKFLLRYASEEESVQAIHSFIKSKDMQGSLVMGRSKPSVYYLDNGARRPVGGMDVLLAYNFSLTDIIHMSDFAISNIPLGESLLMPQ